MSTDTRFQVLVGDITKRKVDAVVNAANSSLLGGGGVDGAIHRAGGGEILAECQRIRETTHPQGLPTGEAVITTGGNLPAGYVIHTVGPVWHGGGQGEEDLLRAAIRNSLQLASEYAQRDPPIHSVAFPAISTGVYGYPKDQAFQVIHREILNYLADKPEPQSVELVLFSQPDLNAFKAATGNG